MTTTGPKNVEETLVEAIATLPTNSHARVGGRTRSWALALAHGSYKGGQTPAGGGGLSLECIVPTVRDGRAAGYQLGVTGLEGNDAAPVPWVLVAVTVKV